MMSTEVAVRPANNVSAQLSYHRDSKQYQATPATVAMPPQRNTSPFLRLSVAFAPLALSFALAWSVTAGPFSLGGGEKDIILVIPLAVCSLLFAVSSLILWAVGASLGRASKLSALVALAIPALAFAVLTAITWR